MIGLKAPQWCAGLVLVVVVCVSTTSATYISWNKKPTRVHHKSNRIDQSHSKRYGPSFKHDWDIQRYLKIYGKDMMIWRCRNAIQPYWNWKPLPLVELYCEAIGTMKSIAWYQNGNRLDLAEKKYGQAIVPHNTGGRYFSRWIDFTLKIYNATIADAGLYTFKVTSPRGNSAEQFIYVDISEKKKKKRKERRNRKGRRYKKTSAN